MISIVVRIGINANIFQDSQLRTYDAKLGASGGPKNSGMCAHGSGHPPRAS